MVEEVRVGNNAVVIDESNPKNNRKDLQIIEP
jgi:hypothetical protein